LREQQPPHGLVAAGDVRVDIDRARHHDHAADVMGLVSLAAGRRDDAAVAQVDVADRVPAVGRVDDAPTGKPRQHDGSVGSAAAIWSIAAATEIAPAGASAFSAVSVPVAGECATLSWSMPGRPTAKATSAPRDNPGAGVRAISGTARVQVGATAR